MKTPEQHATICAERAILDYNNEVIGKGKDINQLFVGCFMEGFLVGRRAGLPEKIKFEQELSRAKCLETANKLLRDSIIEIETHYLTRCVRFLQSFHMKVWWKCSDIGLAFKHLLGAFGLRNRYGRNYKSRLHNTLEAYLNDEKNK
jgi:hypothetical protein